MCRILLIGGSDSSGGAGIQADLRTVSALGGLGLTVLTGVTSQTDQKLVDLFALPTGLVQSQMKAAGAVDAIKVGALFTQTIVDVIERCISDQPLVIDPVLSSTSGGTLLEKNALPTLKRLFARATLITPNLMEAAQLIGKPVESMERAGRQLLELGVQAVLIKGGHLSVPGIDCLVTSTKTTWFYGPPEKALRGTGCILASAIAVGLGQGLMIEQAVSKAKEYVKQCLMC